VSAWGGRKVATLTALVLANKGTICHLCDDDGADSPDHDPPRDDLIRAGVPNPDALVYLWPAHRRCNIIRGKRPITPALKLEISTKRRKYLTAGQPRRDLSPRFRRRLAP
jgi:hypothetical protein